MIAPKPLRSHRKIRLPERGLVTIAAGFPFEGGILLCADTEISNGEMKYIESKLEYHQFSNINAKVGFAFAGSVPHAKRAIRRIVETLSLLQVEEITQTQLVGSIEGVLESEFDRLRKHPTYGYRGGPDFYLLVITWTADMGLMQFASYEECLMPSGGASFIGAGDYFARYISETVYLPTMGIMEIIAHASHVLSQTKAHVPGCGGSSELLVIRDDDGDAAGIDFMDISLAEEFSEPFYRGLNTLYFGLVSETWDDMRLKMECASFLDWLLSVRKKNTAMKREQNKLKGGIVKRFMELQELRQSIPRKLEDQP